MEYLVINKNSGELIDILHIESPEIYLKKHPQHELEIPEDYLEGDLFEEE